MKKIFVLLGVVILAAVVAGGLWFNFNNSGKTESKVIDVQTTRTIEEIAENSRVEIDRSKVYIIGLDPTLVPNTFKDNSGKYIGFDVDLIKQMVKLTGRDIQFKEINYGNVVELLQKDEVDAILNVYVAESRKKDLTFTAPYLMDGAAVIVRRSSDINSEKDLADMIVGGAKGSFLQTEAEKFKNSDGIGFGRFEGYTDSVTAMVELLQGNLNVVVMEEIGARYYISSSPGKFRIIEGIFPEIEVAIALKKGNLNEQKELDAALKKVRESGAYEKIHRKWFGK